ncbi:hypothetical protein C922_02459 [Plasmodium inui San Antonio 1]|uniref:Transcription factor CBF/NF-Y/archaeal histone domain-containing protein n=1 Tax=Plasmodium inui San Antonio 1 TaxID=1237626 RepID=W7ADZ0_9APIC|nr:hypothetical protein C922_02459 [Plasmodium inui San Antonio 1]EUD67309.1 hypothetical protein C922_02459 [Plasmodium inui San Antonio 1]
MKNEEIYDHSRNAPNGDPCIKTEVKDDKDDSNMIGVRYDYIGKENRSRGYDSDDVKSRSFDVDSSFNKLASTIESEINLNEEYEYGYDNEVLVNPEIQIISKILKSKNMSCLENGSPENDLVDTNLLIIEGHERVDSNHSGSFKSADNLNTENKLNSDDTEKVGDIRSGSRSFEANEVHRENIKAGSSHTLKESNMDGEGRHTYLSAQLGYVYDESVSNQDYGKMQYKEMREGGKEYLHFDKREKDDEQDLSGCRGVDSPFDAVESDINFYDQQGLPLGMRDGNRLDRGGARNEGESESRSETQKDYHDASCAAIPPVTPQNTLDYEDDQSHYKNSETQKSVDKSEQPISDTLFSHRNEKGEKKSLQNFESNVVNTNGPTGIIAKENPTETQVPHDRSNNSGLYGDGNNASLSGTPCANDPRGADKDGNEKEALDDVTWYGHKNDKEGSSAGGQQGKANIDIAAVDKESERIKGKRSNEGSPPPTGAENDDRGGTTGKEGTVESDSGDQNEGPNKATISLVEIDKSNEGVGNGHLEYVGVETGKELRTSEEKVVHEKSLKNFADEKGTENGENYGEKTGEDVLVKETMRSAIPSERSNEKEFYNGISVAAPVKVENDLSVTRMKSSSDDAGNVRVYDSNVTSVNIPPKKGSRGGSVNGSGHDDGEDGTTKQEQKGMEGPSAELVRSKDNLNEFEVTKLNNTDEKDNRDSQYAYIKASNTMDDTMNSTVNENANEYELVEADSEVKNEKEHPQIESDNVQMESAYHTVANNNKRRRDSFTNEEMNKERKLNSLNVSLYGPSYGPPYASSYASPRENPNKTFIEHAPEESYEEQKEEKTSYESCDKGQQYVNPQQENQNNPGGNFVSYSKENLGGVIFVNRDNMNNDSSYDNGKSFTNHRTFEISNVVEKVVQENVDTNGAYVPTQPQPNVDDSDPNCKANRIHNVNDVETENNANGYSQHIQVSAKSVKDNCDEDADMENENNNLSDDCKNSSDDNTEKKDSTQFDVNDKKKIKPDSETLLPIANISRIMKRILPASAKVAKESKDIIRECVTEFIQFLTSEASDRCLRERRKTISDEDILFSMEKLGFNDYVEPLYEYLTKWKQLKGMNNSNNCQEKKCEDPKPSLEENTTMKKSLSDVNMNNNAIMGKGADNVILTRDTDHLMNTMYRNPNEMFENNINHMY